MIVVNNRITCPTEMRERLEQGFAHSASSMGSNKGFVKFYLLKSENEVEEGRLLYIAQTVWEDKASFEAWRDSDAFTKAHSRSGSGEGSPLKAELEILEVVVS
jgi:heme-degrading monooxygenase HmoA